MDLELADLHNPSKVVSVLVGYGRFRVKTHYFVAAADQAWQEWPGSWELWQKMEDGRLCRALRVLKKSVIATYTEI